MEFTRLPRFRHAPQIAPMQLTERDRKIIHCVYRHRFLRSTHIIALLGGSSQQILRRLQILFHHGYLERPRAQIDYYYRGGSRHIVYGIGNRGAALLREQSGIDCRELNWSEKNRSLGQLFLEHALLVSDVMVALEISCRQSGRVRLFNLDALQVHDDKLYQHGAVRWSVTVGGGRKLGLVPDRVFALEFLDQPSARNRAYFFLEADRATMPVTRRSLSQSSFYRKLLAYEATWKQELHRSKLGFNRFRVLTITTCLQRTKSLVTACSKLERGHGLFLFADHASFITHGDPLSLRFLTGHPGKTASLLD